MLVKTKVRVVRNIHWLKLLPDWFLWNLENVLVGSSHYAIKTIHSLVFSYTPYWLSTKNKKMLTCQLPPANIFCQNFFGHTIFHARYLFPSYIVFARIFSLTRFYGHFKILPWLYCFLFFLFFKFPNFLRISSLQAILITKIFYYSSWAI